MNDYNFKAFDKVLVRDSEEKPWSCSFYSHYETKYLVHICTNGRDYKYCIPYEGNETLLGTTNSPQPKRWRAEEEAFYYFVDATFSATCEREMYSQIDDYRYKSGNYFQTKEEAQDMADKFKAILKGE